MGADMKVFVVDEELLLLLVLLVVVVVAGLLKPVTKANLQQLMVKKGRINMIFAFVVLCLFNFTVHQFQFLYSCI